MDINMNTALKQPSPSQWEFEATKILFKLRAENRPFSADDFYQEMRTLLAPPAEIKRIAGPIFRRFLASGYIKKLKTYILSNRNGSSVLPQYIGVPN